MSRFKDSGSTALRGTGMRFAPDNKTQKIIPGPGCYAAPSTITETGKNYISRFETSKSRTFGQAARHFMLDPTLSISHSDP